MVTASIILATLDKACFIHMSTALMFGPVAATRIPPATANIKEQKSIAVVVDEHHTGQYATNRSSLHTSQVKLSAGR